MCLGVLVRYGLMYKRFKYDRIHGPQLHIYTLTEFHSCQILPPSIRATILDEVGHIKPEVRAIEVSHAARKHEFR